MALAKFSLEDAKAALKAILVSLREPANAAILDEARENAGNDMVKYMQLVFPVATQMQIPVIMQHGFSGDGEGLVRFTQAVKAYEKQDTEVSSLNEELRAFLLPPVRTPHYDADALIGKQV